MAVFALWTMPVLFSVWLWSSYFKEKNFDILNKFIWLILVIFWFMTISSSYNLLSFTEKQEEKVVVEKQIEKKEIIVETINVWHDGWQLDPQTTTIDSTKSYKFVITPDANGRWCMSTLVIPRINKEIHPVRKGVDIVYELNNLLPWKYPVVCSSMWMRQGEIIVK